MIVKNGAAGLERCLGSVAGLVDRILIGDTGSSDGSQEIASHYDAEVFPVPWIDNFAEARNCVLAHASCDWVLVLDADEMLDEAARTWLPAMLGDETVWAYETPRWNYVRDLGYRSGGEQAQVNHARLPASASYPAYFLTRHTRLFRRDPRIRFRHCVHETVVDSLDMAKLRRAAGSFVIHHFGYVDDGLRAREKKDDLYYRLSQAKLAASPGLYQAHLEAGVAELDHAKAAGSALEHFTAAIALDSTIYVGWLYRGISLTRLGRYEEAQQDLLKAADLNCSNALVHSALGDATFQSAKYHQAREHYERARSLGDASPLSYAKLGACEVQLGLYEQGLLKVQQASAEASQAAELLDILATSALLAGQVALACSASSRRLWMGGASDFHFVLAATIHMHANDLPKAKLILYIGSQQYSDHPEMQRLMLACGD